MLFKPAQMIWAQILYLIPYSQTNCILRSCVLISDGSCTLDAIKTPRGSKVITYRIMIIILICIFFIGKLVKFTKI